MCRLSSGIVKDINRLNILIWTDFRGFEIGKILNKAKRATFEFKFTEDGSLFIQIDGPLLEKSYEIADEQDYDKQEEDDEPELNRVCNEIV